MSDNPKPESKSRSPIFYVLVAAALYVSIQIYPLLSPTLFSLLLILLISLAFNPIISRIRSVTGGRKVATMLLAGALIAALVLTGWVFTGPIASSYKNLTKQLPGYWERFQKPLIKLEQQAVRSEEKLQAEVTTEIARDEATTGKPPATLRVAEPAVPQTKDTGPIRSGLSDMFQGVVGHFTVVAFNGVQILVILVTVFFGVTFTLMNPRPIFGAIFSMVPDNHHEQTLVILQRIGGFMPRWAVATLLGMVTIGVLVFLLTWPIFGLRDALVLALIAAVLEAVPFLGPILSAVPALLLALGEGGMTPVWVLLIYLAVQALENNVILPFIMARAMKLHPLAVMFSMLLCVASFGVLGVLVAAPMVAIVQIVHDELYRKRLLPGVTDADLDRLARKALQEKISESK